MINWLFSYCPACRNCKVLSIILICSMQDQLMHYDDVMMVRDGVVMMMVYLHLT